VRQVSDDDPLLGAQLGPYELTKLLGKGGMGRVYLGVHAEHGTKVAIKVLSEELADTAEALERFVSEAKAAARVEHPAIVRVIDVVRGGGRPHLVMEYVEGETLRTLLPTLTVRRSLQIMGTVLDALHEAHEADIVHRDLKPDNVMITAAGDVRILDFGVAKLLDRMTRLTATGVTVGTSEYMSPEQIRGRPCDGRSDVYAAGVMLFELVTGTRPFEANTEAELLELHLTAPRPSAKLRNRRLSDGIDEIIKHAMAIDPDARFASARDMARAVRAGRVTSARRGPIIALVIVTIAAIVMATLALTLK
jgi:serine/threonine-protein kinase